MTVMSTTRPRAPLPPLGFIVSEMNFHRPPGDPWNDRTWDFPIIKAVAKDSLLVRLVSGDGYDADFINNYVAAGQELADKGCIGLLTSCGFLAMAQNDLSNRLPIPIATSSLLQIPIARAFLREGQTVGVITFDGDRLNSKHLLALGITQPESIPIIGVPDTGKMRACLRDGTPYVHAELEQELVETAKELISKHPNVGAIILECTQFPPFAKSIQEAMHVPVYDVVTLGKWFYSGLARQPFPEWTAKEKKEAKQMRPRSERELMENGS